MSSNERSPKIFSRGLWSTAIMRVSQPRTKNLVLSRASATARASPSTGASRDLAAWVKRLPTKVIRQPVGQQKGCVDGQWQCFWSNQYPIPSLDQSVARHVGFVLSNIRTPSCISLTIKFLDSWKIWSSLLFHLKGVPGLRSARNGSIRSVAANANET